MSGSSRPEGSNRVVLAQAGGGCKNTFGPNQTPLGFEFTFERDRVRISSFNPADEDESGFEDKLPLHERMRRLLADGTQRSSKEIAEELHASESSVKSTLSTNRQIFIREGSYHKGKWTLTTPALSQNRSLKSIVDASIVDASFQSLKVGNGNQLNHLNTHVKTIVEDIVDDRCTPSLLKQGGYINTPLSTINDSTIKSSSHSQPEEVIDL